MKIPSKEDFELVQSYLNFIRKHPCAEASWEMGYPTDKQILALVRVFKFTIDFGEVLNQELLSSYGVVQYTTYKSIADARGLKP